MIDNKIKNLLLKSIVESDFLFLEPSSLKQLRHIKDNLKVNKLNVSLLDIFETLKSLKQFIKLLKFLSEKDEKILHVWLRNKQYLRLINILIDKENFGVDFSAKSSLNQSHNNQFKTQLLFLLNLPLRNNKKTLKRILNEKIFLINKVNLKIEKNDWGSYKIYNDIKNFKKFLFLFIIIDLIFTKTK